MNNGSVLDRSFDFAKNRTFSSSKDTKLGSWDLKTDRDGTYVRLVFADEDGSGQSDGDVNFNLTGVRPVTFSVMNSTHATVKAGYKLVKQ
jgi:hypothetical protein